MEPACSARHYGVQLAKPGTMQRGNIAQPRRSLIGTLVSSAENLK